MSESLPPLTDEDFYLNDDGLMVFTRHYHLKRGYCCKSECRHCPWHYRKKESRKPRAKMTQT